MDWMYNSSTKVDPEEFLLGRAIDKGHFEEPSTQNFMRSIKDEPASSHSQVELSRRMKEDPLTMIREKELEKRKILWKKSQIKNADAKLIPVQVSANDQDVSESKSIHQLIVENLRQLPFKIDLEKFYVRLKEKKKEKKLRKKKNDSSSNSSSSEGVRKMRRPEGRSISRSNEGRRAQMDDYRRDNDGRSRLSAKNERPIHENSRQLTVRNRFTSNETHKRFRRRSRSQSKGRVTQNNGTRPETKNRLSPVDEGESHHNSKSLRPRSRSLSGEKRQNFKRSRPKSKSTSREKKYQNSKSSRLRSRSPSREKPQNSKRSRPRSKSSSREKYRNSKTLRPRSRSLSREKHQNYKRSRPRSKSSSREKYQNSKSSRPTSRSSSREKHRNSKRSRRRSRSSSEEKRHSRRKNPRPRKISKSRRERSSS